MKQISYTIAVCCVGTLVILDTINDRRSHIFFCYRFQFYQVYSLAKMLNAQKDIVKKRKNKIMLPNIKCNYFII